MKAGLFLSMLLLVVFSTSAVAQYIPRIDYTTPAQHEFEVSPSVTVRVRFTTAIDVTTVDSTTVAVYGGLSGYRMGTISCWQPGPGSEASYNPNTDFMPGELVTVALTTGIESVFGYPLPDPYTFNFRIGPAGGSGLFGNSHGINVSDLYNIGRSIPADIDGDGYLDMAVTVAENDELRMFLNNGDGTFSSCTGMHDIPVDPSPRSLCAGDIDLDGDVDFVVSNGSSELVTVIVNTGGCDFVTDTYSINHGLSQPGAIALAVLGDSLYLDIITANSNDNTMSIIQNLENGNFSSTTVEYPIGAIPKSITVEDFDNDGHNDVALACTSPTGIRVFMNNGDGTFGASVEYSTITFANSIVAADFNGDGYADLAVGSDNLIDRVSVNLNNGDGTFAPYVNFPTVHNSDAICPADVDADGDMDIIVATSGASVLYNDGSANFVSSEIYFAQHVGFVAAADMDNDGDMDMVMSRTGYEGYTTDILILDNLNNPTVVSHSPDQNELDVPVNANIVITFDKDMDESTLNSLNIVIDGSSSGRHQGSKFYNSPTKTVTLNPIYNFAEGELVTVTLTSDIQSEDGVSLHGYSWSFVAETSGGSGAFTVDSVYATGEGPATVYAASLNGGSSLDIITANYIDNNISVMFNNGDGTLASQTTYEAGDGPFQICVGDFNRDSDIDISVCNYLSDNVSIYINNGNGTFAAQAVYPVGDAPYSVHAADLNADGYLDLATANYNSDNVSILLNNGDGTFASHSVYSAGNGPRSVIAFDHDGDGDFDLATANEFSDNTSRLFNNGDGTFGSRQSFLVGDAPYSICAFDLDGDGDCDLATSNHGSNDVSVLLNTGANTIPVITEYGIGDMPFSVNGGDLDGDGDIDLMSANYGSDDASIILNGGSGVFSPSMEYATGNGSYYAFPADLDADGDLDLAVVNLIPDNVTILLNQNPVAMTLPISMTGIDIPFVYGPDTLAILNFASETLDSLTITAYPGMAPPGIPPGSDWVRRYYEISPIPQGAVFEADITLFYAQGEFDASGLSDESLLHLYRYDDGAAEWEVQLGTLDMAANCIGCSGVTEFSIWAFTGSASVTGDESDHLPAASALYQNCPNPFNPVTRIRYLLHRDSNVKLVVYNVRGQRVVTLVDGRQMRGYKSVTWNGKDRAGNQVASGVYFYRLAAGAFMQTRKMVLIR